MNVEIIKPYGYCSGVKRVIDLVDKIAKLHQNEKIYCIGQIVHNKIVNQKLDDLNIIVLTKGTKEEMINSINEGVVIFSAHGTDEKIVNMAKEKQLIVYDVVCPFVSKEFKIIKDKLKENYSVIYIGKKNHEESQAALSISNDIYFVETLSDIDNLNIKNDKIAVINQTTLSIKDLNEIYSNIEKKYPDIEIIDEICNSTRIRQEQVSSINKDSQVIIVGDENSNNTKSLYFLAKKNGNKCIMIEKFDNAILEWIDTKKHIVIVSGASTPNEIVEEIYENLKKIK